MAGISVDPDLPAIARLSAGRDGVQRAELEAALRLARERGYGRVEASAADGTAALYEALGFRRTGVESVMALVFPPDVPIETERLRLRFYTDADYDDLLALQSREDVTRHLPWGPRAPDEVRRSLAMKIAAAAMANDGVTFAIERKDSGAYAGDASIWTGSHEHRQGEIGYIVHPDHHGNGFAAEAARPLLELGFTRFGMRRIIGRLDDRNRASARVLEKLGMRREAHLIENEYIRGEWQSELAYGLLEAEWRATASRGA
jgi:RimJ/RimL family protein N-acetyltransferase